MNFIEGLINVIETTKNKPGIRIEKTVKFKNGENINIKEYINKKNIKTVEINCFGKSVKKGLGYKNIYPKIIKEPGVESVSVAISMNKKKL